MPYNLKFIPENKKDLKLKLDANSFTNKNYVNYKNANLPAFTKNIIDYAPYKNKKTLVVDKDVDSAYVFDENKNLMIREPVITGADKGQEQHALTMRQFFDLNKTDDHQAYFDYLKNSGQRNTPSGKFSIGDVRTNVADNPDKIGNAFNYVFRPERYNQIKNNRLKDYGSQQKLLTLYDTNGVGQISAIHGTDNKKRESTLGYEIQTQYKNGKKYITYPNRKLSNSCINVKDDSKILDIMSKNDDVLIGSINDKLNKKNAFIDVSNENQSRRKISYSNSNTYINKKNNEINYLLDKNNIKPIDEDEVRFIQTVREKETKSGTSKGYLIENLLTNSNGFNLFANSTGQFQINPKTFKEYLPNNYTGSLDDQIKALHNFYIKNKDEAIKINNKGFNEEYLKNFPNNNPSYQTNMYEIYNTGKKNTYNAATIKFDKMYKKNTKVK